MPHNAPDIDELDEELKSKSEIKREMHQLQDFALTLVNMSKHQRSRLPLTTDLIDAMVLADKIKNKHEALKRHIRYVGKLLQETDLTPIHQAIDVMANKHQQETAKFVKIENIRDELIAGNNNTVEAFIAEHPSVERQKIKQLIRQAIKEQKAEKIGKAHKDLFAYIKEHSISS